jgi:uncharacterized membrane protein YdjX (TVP38/TMEM64 family)
MQNKNHNQIKFLVFITTLILFVILGRYFRVDTATIQNTLRKFSFFYAGILFIILYCGVTFFIWLSKDIFRFVSAILFGAYLSTLLVFIAEVINAFILFFFSRFFGREFVKNSLKGKYENLDARLSQVNFFWLFMFRAVPLIPFRFLDLACGLTGMPFKIYLIAVILGSPLRIFWVQYVLAGLGKSIFNNPYALVEYLLNNKTLFIFSFVYLLLVILVAVKLKGGRYGRRILHTEKRQVR